ncbi:UvrB/UvrC motif-containing protein [Mangrovibacterium diazotrophicum]|uniref:UvrB/UvrC motif-containing protein n=1 Tax=Mangrovibacterium diazotrophicum TaxID=1261403 RepID=A0A419W3G8_9BACT|nr:UvrB/UvrC motif-containing protein [Mangrovibacterium diazotrophicum]RKD90018.1 UvrB/UvrC motif-containing protein [Mangrovibacterium diazotrophicum]
MKRLIEIADKLNELLNVAELDMSKLQSLAYELNEIPDLRIKLIDFEQYNEENLSKLTEEKLKYIKEQNFEKAANVREEEKECFKYANFQQYFNLKHSFFYPEEGKLFYFHLGTERNDRPVKYYLFGE